MRRTHIVLLLITAGLMAALIGTFTSTSESVDFARAFEEPGVIFKVSGTLDHAHPIEYDPEADASTTRFHMKDRNGVTREVLLNEPKRQGLEQSESIDLYGKVIDGRFQASKMLMKCPSKYNEQSHEVQWTESAS
jgi:cytochrome c-type biogenesis protein CcmE